MDWDVFISHASEDREYSRAIATALSKKGLRVWFDDFELHVGDSLRKSIDKGLSKSRYGIVVLSPDFFAKEWTQKELGALTAREAKGRKIVLPIWHSITEKEIRKYSPLLADRFAINSAVGIDKTVDHLLSVIVANKPKPNEERTNLDKQLKVELKEAQLALGKKEMELRAIIAQADELAHTDSLTFLPNRRQIIADLKRQVLFAERYNTPLSISILNFDHLKAINDTYGHAAGDDVLKFVALKMRESIRLPDMVGRYDSDMFVFLFPNSALKAASEQAASLCEQVRSLLITSGEYTIHITVSIGIAQYRIHEENWEQLFHRADHALHLAKKNGRDQWVIIDS